MGTDELSNLVIDKEEEQGKLWEKYKHHMDAAMETFNQYLEITKEVAQLRVDQYNDLVDKRENT